jgi:hypothetical protein
MAQTGEDNTQETSDSIFDGCSFLEKERGSRTAAVKVMESTRLPQLISFLQEELLIPSTSIALAMRHPEHSSSLLPIILWQYGLVSLKQLEKIFDWLETTQKTQELTLV